MGCCGSSSTYAIAPEAIPNQVAAMKSKYSSGNVLIMSIKDQNVPGKLCMSGAVDSALTDAITTCLRSDPQNEKVTMENDKYDLMWDVTWRETRLTTGHSAFSLAKSYFPRGKLIVKLLDTIAGFGWDLAACPNMGGVESRDKNGNVTSTVDWPVFIFYKAKSPKYGKEHLLFAVKDSNIPGKLCAAGPVGDLETSMTKALKEFTKDAESKKDDYDNDFDVVWRNTSITTGMKALSFAKSYFPKGKTNIAILECAYQAGWRVVAAPNFGGWNDSWPCYILRKVQEPVPELLFASIKDSNLPGKLCISGKSADGVTDAMCGALAKVPDNGGVKSQKDEYDEDHDAVARDIHITTGMQAFSFRCKYFPRGDSMKTMLDTFQGEGFQVVACPNFGGMADSWPTFVMEKRPSVPQYMYLAVKDDNIPGKVGLVGGGVASDADLAGKILDVFKTLCGDDVVQQLDDYDKTYELAFRNTRLTTGHATFSFQKPYWPHGAVIYLLLEVLLQKGWMACGGPNFGDDGNTWPGIIFTQDGA